MKYHPKVKARERLFEILKMREERVTIPEIIKAINQQSSTMKKKAKVIRKNVYSPFRDGRGSQAGMLEFTRDDLIVLEADPDLKEVIDKMKAEGLRKTTAPLWEELTEREKKDIRKGRLIVDKFINVKPSLKSNLEVETELLDHGFDLKWEK